MAEHQSDAINASDASRTSGSALSQRPHASRRAAAFRIPLPTGTLWDFWAPRYHGLWVQRFSLGPTRRLLHAHLDAVAPSARRILDVGCGIGQLAGELAARRPGARVVGLDTSAEMIARARREQVAPNLEFHHVALEDLPRGDGFDVIVSTHAFPYVPDQPAAIRTFASLLEPGGRLLLAEANDEGWYDRAWLLFVKVTTTKARYPSAAAIHGMMRGAGLTPGVVRSIDKAFFVPSIQMVEGIR